MDAVEFEREQQRALSRGTFVDPRRGDESVANWSDTWLKSLTGLAEDTCVRYESLIRLHVLTEFGRRPLHSVRPSEIQSFAARLSDEYSASTARQAVGVLRQVYSFAKNDGAVHVNPCEGVKLARSRPNAVLPLSHEELWKLANATGRRRDALLILVGGYTGMRWGELSALRRIDFVPREQRLEVNKAFADVRGKLVLGDVKDHSSRSVVVPESVSVLLDRWCKGLGTHELVFSAAGGVPLRNRNFRRDVLDKASKSIDRPVTAHHLRDTAASLAISEGASVLAVARMLGHEDPSVTLRHYASLFPADLGDIATRMERGAEKEWKRYGTLWKEMN